MSNLSRGQVDVHDLRSRLHGLRHVKVHFVAVKVGVVGTRVAEVHAEGGPRKNLDPVAHHGHLVERRLAVEDDVVAVVNVALDSVAALQMQVGRLRVVAEIDSLAGVADDVLGAGVLRVSASDELLHLVDVEGGDDFRERHVLGDGPRHSDLSKKNKRNQCWLI